MSMVLYILFYKFSAVPEVIIDNYAFLLTSGQNNSYANFVNGRLSHLSGHSDSNTFPASVQWKNSGR